MNCFRTVLIFAFTLFLMPVVDGVCQDEKKHFSDIGYSPSIPPSPEASALGKYGQYEVNLAYGIPEISVPLFAITSGHLPLNASLSYHAGGNKVKEEGSWVGLGWSLNLGGVVTRVARGVADDEGVMSPEASYMVDSQWYRDGITDADTDKLSATADGNRDTEPDAYTFNFAGYSGEFVFDNAGNATVIPYQPLEITKIPGSCLDVPGACTRAIKIVTPDGTEYFFETIEVTQTQAGRRNTWETFVSSWYLTRIVHANKFDLITFEYSSLDDKVYPFEKVSYVEYSSNSGAFYGLTSTPPERYSRIVIKKEKRISKVHFNNGRVDVSSDGINVYDLTNGPVLTHSIQFDISEFAKSSGCGADDCRRKKLNHVIVNGSKHTFTYNESMSQPSYNSNSVDHWGYYNAANNASPIPTFRYAEYDYGGGANRNVNNDAAQFGIIRKIVYPTGGWSEFEFESNRISQVDANGMERISIAKDYTFVLYADKRTTGSSYAFASDHSGPSFAHLLWNWPPPNEQVRYDVDNFMPVENVTWDSRMDVRIEYGTAQGNDGQPLQYVKTPQVILTVNGSSVVNTNYTSFDGTYDDGQGKEIRITNLFTLLNQGHPYTGNNGMTGTLSLQTSTDDNNYVKVKMTRRGYYYVPPSGASDILVGGLRIKNITSYDADGSMITKKHYDYVKPGKPAESSGVLLNAHIDDLKYLYPYYSTYLIGDAGGQCPGMNNRHRLVAHNNPAGRMNSGYAIGYQNVTELALGPDDEKNGRIEYDFSMIPDDIASGYPLRPAISRSIHRGKPWQIRYYNNNNFIVKRVQNEYGTGGSAKPVYAAVIVTNREFPWYQVGECYLPTGASAYSVAPYVLTELSDGRLLKTITTEYKEGTTKALSTEQRFVYDDSKYQSLISKTTLTGKDILEQEYTYQHQLNEPGVPVNLREERSKVNDRVVAARKVLYTLSYPVKIFNWRSSTPDDAFTDLTLLESDDGYESEPDATITYAPESKRTDVVRGEDGISTCYLWDEKNNELIAAVKNCSSSDAVAFASFDNPSHRINNDISASVSFTGKKGYDLLSGALATLPFAAGKYAVEFWAKTDVANAVEVKTTSGSSVKIVDMESGAGTWKKYRGLLDFEHLSETETFTVEVSGSAIVDEVRIFPANAMMTSYSYRRFTGVTSVVDPAGQVTFYEYDANGRLVLVRDENGNILQRYQYNLINK